VFKQSDFTLPADFAPRKKAKNGNLISRELTTSNKN
jgi:hypothetical protein